MNGSVAESVDSKQTLDGTPQPEESSHMNEKRTLSPIMAGPRGRGNSTSSLRIPPLASPMSWRENAHINRASARRKSSLDLSDYYQGPRDVAKHSKWPFFMRLHGSVLPKMILPLTFIAAWSTAITLICEKVTDISVESVLLTVLGFVVGLGLSFRSSTAYERYAEGRKYWAQLQFTAQNMSRIIWVNSKERPGDDGKKDLLGKLTALNLITAFAQSLKHKIRFEPGIHHEDLRGLVEFVDSFARAAEETIPQPKAKTPWKATGEYLGVSFAESNPRKYIKRANEAQPIGNLPLEILKYLSAYAEQIIDDGNLPIPGHQTIMINGIVALNEVMSGVERVLNTPMPLAYNIAISQITWVYVLLLPFQLYSALGYITIPGTIFAAYIILGLAAIGREIENPFGSDVNDLPLDAFCQELSDDINIMCATPGPQPLDFITAAENLPLWPISHQGANVWAAQSKEEIREALMQKANANLRNRKSIYNQRKSEAADGHAAERVAPMEAV